MIFDLIDLETTLTLTLKVINLDPEHHWSWSHKVKTINQFDMLRGSKIGQKLIFELSDLLDLETTFTLTLKVIGQGNIRSKP